ncbi:MAG: sigma-70 family RNA polymerase sigma factor [Deltaproteobacteria bacterium]|nr:sigma-70 family RNA polymerase sigma factor [Deltaproteobacteria bacterium]
MERSDQELVRETRAGNAEAFRELVERYQRKVAAVAMGMVHNRDDALELTQETFVKAFENIGKFKGESSFYTWLYRIVVNLGIDYRRRERRHPTVALDDQMRNGGEIPEELLGSPVADPFREFRSHEIGERVSRAINELTPDHKAVILLREVEGLSYDEISRVMQCSKGTVMSRLHYARKKLQDKLRDCL